MTGRYGFWTVNGHRNGLEGAPSRLIDLPDGRSVVARDETFPAVLEDAFILNAIHKSRTARAEFNRLFPLLDAVSQQRLTDMLLANPREAVLVLSDKAFADALQHQNVTEGVRVRLSQRLR